MLSGNCLRRWHSTRLPASCSNRGTVHTRSRRGWSLTLTQADTPITIGPALPADLLALGRLGALLVRIHHDLDPPRFIAASPRTEHGYASWLGSQLDNPRVLILAAAQNAEVLSGPKTCKPSACS